MTVWLLTLDVYVEGEYECETTLAVFANRPYYKDVKFYADRELPSTMKTAHIVDGCDSGEASYAIEDRQAKGLYYTPKVNVREANVQ